MLIISINIRGFRAKVKEMALHHFISLHNPDLFLVQEATGVSHGLYNFLERSLKGWSFTRMDSSRKSRGIISSWHDSMMVIIVFAMSSS